MFELECTKMQSCLVIQKCEASIVLPIQNHVTESAEIYNTLDFVLNKCINVINFKYSIKEIKYMWYYDKQIFFLPVNFFKIFFFVFICIADTYYIYNYIEY